MDINFDKLAIAIIDEFESDREYSGRDEIVKGMEYVLNKYTSEHDREIIDQMLMTFTGWTLQTLLEKAEEVSDEEIEARAFRVISQNSKSTNKSIDKDGLLDYIKEEFPGVIDTHWNWDVLENIIDYATSKYNGEELIKFLMNIIPEVTYEEYLMFM